MPIVHMASSKEEAEARGGVNIRNVTEQWSNHGVGKYGELWLYDTHVGLCIEESERNMHDDSDFYMLVWEWNEDGKTGAATKMMFGTTRGWSYPCMASHVDASPEVLAAYAAYQKEEAAKRRAHWEKEEALMPRKGRTVRVMAGRKLAKGTEAEVFWERIESRGFLSVTGEWWKPKGRIGLRLASGERVFVAASQVEVVAG